MHYFLYHTPIKQWKDDSVNDTLDPLQESPQNITEGSEFLDDAIRTGDQPLMHTEESIAAGSPKDLL